ncbi:MAG TPA: CCA tRNA nucleotidyltransferase [Pirellulales bacterium]
MGVPLDPAKQQEFAVEVVAKLRAAGYEALWAGGCVRDWLLGRTPKDFDVATSARPEQVRVVFGAKRTLAIGAQFGVIAVLGPRGAGQVEVATFREDGDYSDGRRPDEVRFSSPERDAQRRDFTINGMFFDPIQGVVHDYVEGQADLNNRLIRAIGDPLARITEDKLRMLRAVRFTTTFDFILEDATRDAVRAMSDQITVVSGERICQELRRLLVDPHRARGLELLRDVNLLRFVLPEWGDDADALDGACREYPGLTHWQAAAKILTALESPSFPLALAAALVVPLQASSEAPPDPRWARLAARRTESVRLAEAIAARLKLSNDEADRAAWLWTHRDELNDAPARPWSEVQPLLVAPGADELIALAEARRAARDLPIDDLRFCRDKLALPPAELNPPPLLNGGDLIKHCVPKGPIYRTLLDAVRAAQLNLQIGSRDEALALVDRLVEKQQ